MKIASERKAIAAPLRGFAIAVKSARVAMRLALATITIERANSAAGTGRSTTRRLTIASCRLNAAQAPIASAAPGIVREAEAGPADMGA